MSGNTEPEEGGRGIWLPALCVAAAGGAVGLYLWWQKKKIEEMEVKLMRNSLSIHRSQVIPFIEFFSTFSSPPEEKRNAVRNGYASRGTQFLLSELDDLEDLLVERQRFYCSYFTRKSRLELMEKKIKDNANILIWYNLIKKEELDKIFREDRHCASCVSYLWTGDKRKNGKLMWEMLEGWRKAATENIKDKDFQKVFEDKENFRSTFQR
ncbi:uncharacterized protein LOC103147905 [Poecilia formosa]|uniref:uncharacterized protein LOC103147905 n=1 Tax=Poecilia formosa TaxID=48698 RepID=UPI0007B90988|nr:PREDICTED: uncharacterized protein LOC103147905 [Poecilia formosa]XP_016534361.1 PREDICTED: uncharacterized protein LOC103147905 [Poecilia formosa]